MNKSQLTRQAAKAVETLKMLDSLLGKSVAGNNYTTLTGSAISLNFDGLGDFDILPNGHKRSISGTGHDQLSVMVWHTEIKECINEVAQDLLVLFPGQPLHLCIDKISTPSRYALYLGAAENTYSTPQSRILETPLSRWKAPLVRLASYLDLKNVEAPENIWVFLASQEIKHTTGKCGSFQAKSNKARSFEHAYKQYTFCSDNYQSNNKPTREDFGAAFLIGDITSSNQDFDTKGHRDDLEEKILAAGTALRDTIITFKNIKSGQIVLDIKTKSVHSTIQASPLMNPKDAAVFDQTHAQALALCEDVCGLLHEYAETHHPYMQEGRLVLNATMYYFEPSTSQSWDCISTLDGYSQRVFLDNLAILADTFAILNDILTPNETHLYVAFCREEFDLSNKEKTYILIKASNFDHARFCLSSHLGPMLTSTHIAQIFVQDYETHIETTQRVNESITALY